jgi:hypothetical protein
MEHQERRIAEYVEGQCRGEEAVTHVERMLSTKVLGTLHEVWDVRTDADRYWVITEPTNLYSQEEFKSADYCLSFHIGLMMRVMERERVEPTEATADHVGTAWRKYEQAVEAFNSADEAEAYQSVGIHCREALIALGRHLAEVVPEYEAGASPKASDFKAWSEAGAEHVATGRLRAYLKGTAERAWDLSVWLQHYADATPWDADLVLEATSHTVSMFGTAIVRHTRGPLPRCPQCASYRVEMDGGLVGDDLDTQWEEHVCGGCGHRWDHHFVRLDPGNGWVRVSEPEARS